MATSSDGGAPNPKRRSVGKQLHRSPTVIHVSWLAGVAVILSASAGGGFGLGGILLLVVVFLPIIVAYRRDRLSLRIVFASLFLLTWPWAMYMAASRKPGGGPGDVNASEQVAPA